MSGGIGEYVGIPAVYVRKVLENPSKYKNVL